MSDPSIRRRLLRLCFLGAGLGLLVWQAGPRVGVCVVPAESAFGGRPMPEFPKSVPAATASLKSELGQIDSVSAASAAHSRRLWSFAAAPVDAADIEQRIPANSHHVHYVEIDQRLLAGKSAVVWRRGESLQLPLPGGREAEVVITKTEARGPDRFVVWGSVVGRPEAQFVLSSTHGRVSASLDGVAASEIKIRTVDAAGRPVVQLYTVDDMDGVTCGARAPSLTAQAAATTAVSGTISGLPRLVADEPLISGQAVVDLLVAYTSAARASLGGTSSMIAEIDLAVTKVQSDFANSGIDLRIRLVGTMEVGLPGDTGTSLAYWQKTVLGQLAATQDGIMDEIHARRNEVGADLVSLVVRRPDPESRGIAYLMGSIESFIEPFFAFSVTNVSNLSDGVVLSHELGHNFGCAHDRDHAGGVGGAYAYSYGYRATGTLATGNSVQVRTIMAYSPGTRRRYFSGPEQSVATYLVAGRDVSFTQPVMLGAAEGASDEADNARTIRQTAFQVANYRLAPDRSAAGRLVNVSTRAWVGSDVQTLIGGFVLGGDSAKQILVRALGPTIGASPYHVPGALVDPELRVDHIGEGTVGVNDDWSLPAENGLAVAAAATATGAIALETGTLDAGLVMELSPGSYTASVVGEGGSEGYGLVEVYEVGTTGEPRLLNLSTRGFADVDRPMVAGFVVKGDPGAVDQRKTMFIRVRGPSLANYGLAAASVMSDPLIEIYDATAQLVYVNDDWDSPSADLDGTNRDGIPLLRRGQLDQLSEQAVFDAASAVGATDMEPNEPGVVIELPPGIYTVFVMPFEALPEQPAEPGVAIVEVFEVDL